MKKILRVVFAAFLLGAILLVCSACVDLDEIKQQKKKEARKEAIRNGYYDVAMLPAER